MTTKADDTALEGDEAPDDDAAKAAAAAAATQSPDELATLKSRNSGLNAKVTELQKQLADERSARTAAEEAAAGKAGTDDVLNKRIAELQTELEAGKQAVALSQKGAKFPEAFKELGEDIASMAEEKLAALEARLTAAKDEDEEESDEPKKPVGNNAARGNTGPKNLEDMTVAELRAYGKTLKRGDMGLS